MITMKLSRSRAWLLSCSAMIGVLALTPAANAATDADATPATGTATATPPSDPTAVDEIVVTGGLRAQRLQDAPMAVTAVAAQEFTDAGYKSPSDLQFLSPSVQVSVQGANAIYIRGSGTNSALAGTEQSVGLVIDGVIIGFVDDIGGDISDLDHIEVYRGPQGTQFAKNSTAGTVAIMTKNPVIGENSTELNASYGEHNDTADSITQNVAVGDDAAARLTASFQHRDGVFDNTSLDRKEGGREQLAVRGKFLWEPSPNTRILFSADARRTSEYPNFPQAWGQCGPTISEFNPTVYGGNFLPPCHGAIAGAAGSAGTGLVVKPDNTTSVENQQGFRHTDAGGGSLQIDQSIGDYTLTSITAGRYMDRQFHGPLGSGYYSSFFLDDHYAGAQYSEELRLSSPSTGKLTYVGGIFLYERDTNEEESATGDNYGQAKSMFPNTPYGDSVLASFFGGTVNTHNINRSYAAFADGSYHFTDKLQLNAGLRVTHDEVYASDNVTPIPGVFGFGPANPPASLSIDHTGLTYRVGPQYFITPDIQLYATYAHGYKGPLIDSSVAAPDAVKPEEVDMYETGIKSTWLDHKLTADLTLFHEKYTNYQIQTFNQTIQPPTFQEGNAGGLLSQGVELELNARPVPAWQFSGSLSLDDNHYTDFLTSCWNALEPIRQQQIAIGATQNAVTVANANPGACIVSPGGSSVTQAADSQLVNSSKYTFRLGAVYNHKFENAWVGDISANYLWRSKFLSAAEDPNLVNPSYGILNLNAEMTSPNGKYKVGIFARNALSQFFTAGRQAGDGGYTNVLNPEAVRTVGVSLSLKL
jgi:iron complex outermembrane receptor protein